MKVRTDEVRMVYLMDADYDDSKGIEVNKAFLLGGKVPNPTSTILEEDRPYAFVSNTLAYGIAIPSCANPVDRYTALLLQVFYWTLSVRTHDLTIVTIHKSRIVP